MRIDLQGFFMSKKEKVLVCGKLMLPQLRQDLENEFDITLLVEQADAQAFLKEKGAEFTGLVTSAGVRTDAGVLDHLPNLRVVSSFGVGYDHLDEATLTARALPVGYTPEVLNDCVADLAMGLMLDISRGLSAADRYVRQGKWLSGPFTLQRRLSGKRLGILGLGRIGEVIARRASGFDMEIGYHNRSRRDDVPHTWLSSPAELARWADYFMVAVTGGPATAGLVDAAILDALGPDGFLINIARGSVIDEPALVKALQEKRIAGAALDVFVNEPNVPEALMSLDNVVLLPHIASGTHETRRAMADLVMDNLRSFYATGSLKAPVPWSAG